MKNSAVQNGSDERKDNVLRTLARASGPAHELERQLDGEALELGQRLEPALGTRAVICWLDIGSGVSTNSRSLTNRSLPVSPTTN